MAQVHDRLGHLGGVGVGQHALHEAAVDLQPLHRETVEVMQVGEAGTEVVHRQQHAVVLEQFEAAAQRIGVTDQRRLGQLQLQPLRRPAVAAADLQHALGEATVAQLHRRHVHRDAAEHQALLVPGHRLAAGLAQHPVAQAHDLAAFLGDGNEFGRAAEAVPGSLPAQQRLDRRGALAHRGDQRLVDQRELLAVQRAMQRVLQLQPPLGALQHVLAVIVEGVAAGLLGRVHRRVGGAQQAVEVLQLRRLHGDADAGADLQRDVVLAQRLGQRRQQLARDVAGILRLGQVAQHDHELVVAEAREQVAVAQLLVQPRGGQLQQGVAGGMAEGVVDALEAVQVDQQHRQGLATLAGLAHRFLGALAQQEAVRQAGQAVVVRQQLDALVGLAFAADVAEQHHEARRQALAAIELDQHLHPHALARRPVEAQLQLLGQAAVADPLQRGFEGIARILGVQRERLLQRDRLLAQAVDAVALLGPLHAAGVDLDLAAADAAQRRDPVEQFGAPADQRIGLALLGDVLGLAGHAQQRAVAVEHRLRPQPHVLRRLAFGAEFQFEMDRLAARAPAPPGPAQGGTALAAELAQQRADPRRQCRQRQLAGEILRQPEAATAAVPAPAAHAGDALGLFELGLLLAKLLLEQLVVVDVGMRAHHAQGAPVGRPRDHPAAVADPAPLAIALAQPEFGAVAVALALQVRADRLADPRRVLRMHQFRQRGQVGRQRMLVVAEHLLPALGAVDHVGGDIPVPQAVLGAVQADLPAAGDRAGRLGDAQRIGQQRAILVAHRAQPGVPLPVAAGQHAGAHAALAAQALAAVGQLVDIQRQGGRQADRLRYGIGRERPPMRIEHHHRRGQWVLQQTCDDAWIHAGKLRFSPRERGERLG